jgi:cyclic pyranopterin phosphate synthase
MKIRSYLDPQSYPPGAHHVFGQTMLKDNFARSFSYLRLSITDKCNFRCQYCLPDGYKKAVMEEPELSRLEIARLVRGFASFGLRKIRITGGEPSLRRDLTAIIEDLSTIDNVKTIALSTNGYRLERDVNDWVAAGLNSVNVSVDSLDPAAFATLTGSDSLPLILKGIQKAVDTQLLAVKINAVLHRHTTTEDILRFFDYVKHNPVTVRFIELMETASTHLYFESEHLSSDRVVDFLRRHGWNEMTRLSDAGPAREFSHPDFAGKIGVIAPYSPGFCESCNRLRVTSKGQLHTCLFGSSSQSLRELLQEDSQLSLLKTQIAQSVAQKQALHSLQTRDTGLNYGFSALGG